MLQSPPDGGLLNDPTPLFRVKYDALCGASSCGFPGSFFSSFSLSASLDASDVGSSFVFDPVTGTASWRPSARLADGFHTFTAQARDSFGDLSNTVSASFMIDTVAPAFLNVAPPSGSVFITTSSVTITGSVDDATANVSLGGQTQGANFSFTVALSEGVNNFTLVARDTAGNSAPYPLTYTYSPPQNIPPTVSMFSPTSGTPYSAPASIHVAATASDSDGTIARVEFLRNGVVEATATTLPYEAMLTNVPAGTQTLTARAVDDRGATTTSAPVTVPVTAISITITSPAANAVINSNNTVVTGRIVAPANSGVNVNDTGASVDGSGNFTVLISLVGGVNTITAKLATTDGTVLTQSISVTATGAASPYTVGADPLIGIAPLTVVFKLANPTGSAAVVNSNVFGSFVLPAGSTATGSLSFPAGVFVPTFTFNGTFTHSMVVESRDATQMDQMFRSIWSSLNAALVGGDKTTALRYFNGKAQQKYGPVFDVLLPFMSEIVASYSTLARSSITADLGTYAVVRVDNGVRRIYFIYFMRDPDGVWRIDEM
jgi:Big-like domain-containing protein/glucodextranase-like protein